MNGLGENDRMNGCRGSDSVNGNTGNDGIAGGIGNDVVSGGNGDDNVQGGAGNDKVFGNAGVNILTGGGGNDIFFCGPNGQDRITDFQPGQDLRFGTCILGPAVAPALTSASVPPVSSFYRYHQSNIINTVITTITITVTRLRTKEKKKEAVTVLALDCSSQLLLWLLPACHGILRICN